MSHITTITPAGPVDLLIGLGTNRLGTIEALTPAGQVWLAHRIGPGETMAFVDRLDLAAWAGHAVAAGLRCSAVEGVAA